MRKETVCLIGLWVGGVLVGFGIQGLAQQTKPRTIEQKYQRLIGSIKYRMAVKERWALDKSVGVATQGKSHYIESGYVSAKSFLMSTDGQYKMLNELLKEGTE